MKFDELAILLTCHTFEDFPVFHRGKDADSLLASWTALWHPLLIANGPSFHAGGLSGLPTGAIDLLPTILTLLELHGQESALPGHFDGRVLWEILASPQGEPGEKKVTIIEPANPVAGRAAPQLQLESVGMTTYVHGQVNPVR